ncbi:hypothetical protein [Vibrio brasiliensis]|uniref:Coenzyme F390 synthetase-like protein n=1 Tax=Vibrio brasiliensis LMG 20546 TaxID=945543 RepID=E8M052_9VIBR|nr:hypothetical protein [Vibrio brasiliensis]EGA63704.1 Coenzyme F390 synthetase-like protein [Vibrio brasiliensis LMG 20546]
MLYDEQRYLIEEVFRCKVYDFYGSRESSGIAAEYDHRQLKHIFIFNNIVEVVDDRILVTNLHNYTMPLIRFDILDSGRRVSKHGEDFILEGLNGRVFDYLIGKDGKKIHAQYFITLFFGIDEIKNFSVVQTKLDEVIVYYVLSVGSISSSVLNNINSDISGALELPVKVNWEEVDEIPKTKSGKYIYVRSEL